MAYNHYVAVFRCRSLVPPLPKVVVQPVKVELVQGPIELEIPGQLSRIHVIGKADKFVEVGTLRLPEGENYLIISVQSKEGSPEILNGHLDRTITAISFLHQPQFFFEQMYRGPLAGQKMIIEGFARPAKEEKIDPKVLAQEIRDLNARISRDAELHRRFTLMSRFYSRSLDFDPSEEKFMMLWTALEIHPMHGTSNIRPLKDLIAQITGRSVDEVENAIGIGRLYGARSDLVHDGRIDKALYEDIFRKLELLLHEVLRSMVNLPYSKELERFFEIPEKT